MFQRKHECVRVSRFYEFMNLVFIASASVVGGCDSNSGNCYR